MRESGGALSSGRLDGPASHWFACLVLPRACQLTGPPACSPTPLRHLIPSSSSSSTASSPLFTALQSLAPPYSSPSPSPTSLPSLPHAGLTRSLLSSLSAPSSPAPAPAPRIAALLAYTAEGPSAPLAHELATSLARVLELPLLPGGGWTEPLSWERGLMGVELERDGAGREMFS